MKLSKFLLLVLFAQCSYAQVKVHSLDKKTIPVSIKYVGRLINAVRYTDSGGDYVIVTTETGETKTKGADDDTYRDAALYAYCYKNFGNQQTLIWKVNDFVNACPVDIRANYVPNTFAVTDLNKDGMAEVWLMYKTVCHGDVCPSNMKIIMYQGNKKYAVRGTNKVKVSDKTYDGGGYTFDEAFKNAPQSFRSYALQLWKKNLLETW